MKSIKILALLMSFVLCGNVWGQFIPEDEDAEGIFSSIEVLYSSPGNIEILALGVVRFEQNASAYLKWEQKQGVVSYLVRYKLSGEEIWTEIQSIDNQIVIEGIFLNAEYFWEVRAEGYVSDKIVLSTHPQKDPILVSGVLYSKLASYFSDLSQFVPFDNFINGLDIHPYEKLSFQQVYSFDNKSFRYSNNLNDLSSFYPKEAGSNELTKPFYFADCGCKVITSGSLSAAPLTRLDEERFVVVSIDSQYIARGQTNSRRTFVDRFEAGPAKFISLRQNQGGFTDYQLSSIDSTGGIPIASATLDFFLGCLGPGGTFNPALPDRCLCDRPLDISAQYTTRLHVKAERKSCIGNKSARAEAEDFAVLWVRERNSPVMPLAAGQFSISQACSSTLNSQFFIGLVGVLGAILPVAIRNLDTIGSNNSPTPIEINQFVNALQNLIGTPIMIRDGQCISGIVQPSTLVNRDTSLVLRPNRPIRVGLSSGFHLRTTGTNCYKSEAGIASDYFLMGVVRSRLTEDSECCADKYANYIVGSLSTPSNGDVVIDAVHDIADRLRQVGQELATYGDWDGHQRTPVSNIIDLQGRQFNRLVGRWCTRNEIVGNGSWGGENGNFIASNEPPLRHLRLFPNPTGEIVTISWQMEYPTIVGIRILNMQGRTVQEVFRGGVDSGENQFQIAVKNWVPGNYIAQLVTGIETRTIMFTVH